MLSPYRQTTKDATWGGAALAAINGAVVGGAVGAGMGPVPAAALGGLTNAGANMVGSAIDGNLSKDYRSDVGIDGAMTGVNKVVDDAISGTATTLVGGGLTKAVAPSVAGLFVKGVKGATEKSAASERAKAAVQGLAKPVGEAVTDLGVGIVMTGVEAIVGTGEAKKPPPSTAIKKAN